MKVGDDSCNSSNENSHILTDVRTIIIFIYNYINIIYKSKDQYHNVKYPQ